MSFNNAHINITRANYEEAFLLYIDGELNEEGMAAVQAFVLLHPDLQEELDLLLTTKLDSEVFVLEGKERLLAENMKAEITDDALLLYIDGELSPKEKLNVEKKLAADIAYHHQYQLLLSTKLPVDEAVVYPNKAELYRHTEKHIQPAIWMRIAAAVILLLGIGVFLTNLENKKDTPVPLIVQAPGKNADQQIINQLELKSEKSKPAEIALQQRVELKTEKMIWVKKENKKDPAIPQSFVPAPDERDRVVALQKAADIDLPASREAVDQSIVQQQTINNNPVTTTTAPTYTTIDGDAKTETMVSTALAISNDDKRGSVRGFLRKASRFIERRTGINPVNEDDELMIGVVALKLK